MNKPKRLFLLMVIIVAVLLFFPYSTKKVISGYGEVQTIENEKLGNCTLSIEICQIRSLCFLYKSQFSYVLDGKEYATFEDSTYLEAGEDICMISQMYYDKTSNEMKPCRLVFPKDLSYALIEMDNEQYYLKNTP